MHRRRFLRNFLAGATALAFAPNLLRAEAAGNSTATMFARSLASHPWLEGWKTVGVESLGPTTATIEGRWPAELTGTLYRNGPAWFDRAGLRYKHWFDGDGMMHAWRIGNDGIRHRARMIATTKFEREQRAGRFLVPAVGTTIPGAESIRNNDDLNTANTSVIRIGDRLFALWEAGSAIELDPDDLRTSGPITWRGDLAAAPFSAHPLRDRDGSVWNFGSLNLLGGSGLMIWHLGSDGRLAKVATINDEQGGYLHSFAMSERYLVFVLTPYRMREGGEFFERMQFAPDLPCRVAVVPKDALDQPRWFDVDFGMVYHFADAFERGNEIVVRAVRHSDIADARSPMAAAMRGEIAPHGTPADLAELHIDLGKGRVRWVATGIEGIEFPTFDPDATSLRGSRIYAPIRVKPTVAPYSNAIASIDTMRGRRDVHSYGDSVLAEEHLFVPNPGRHRAGQGWLLGTVLDHRKGRSGLAVLDAEHVSDGPLAIAWLPYTFPLGFHGTFSSRVERL